jgi:3-oxoacyl-[acyl-carrier-protein] synthase-3
MGINILGTGSYVPQNAVSNDDLSKLVETNDEWIRTRTGITSRRISKWEPTWYMGAKAAVQAIEKSGADASEIGLIITSSVTSDLHTPSISSVIQAQIGAENAFAFDINAACSGFIYAVDTAQRFLATDSTIKYALVVSTENLTDITDFSDRNTCVLFGDGAAAVVIEKSDKLYTSYLNSDGSGAKHLYAKCMGKNPTFAKENESFNDPFAAGKMHAIIQNGKEVYKFAVKALPNAMNEAARKINFDMSEIDYIVPHQANVRIIETASKNIGVPMEKFIITLDHYGNTSSASIPLALNEAIESGKIKHGQKIGFVGFGAGLTSGAIILEY